MFHVLLDAFTRFVVIDASAVTLDTDCAMASGSFGHLLIEALC